MSIALWPVLEDRQEHHLIDEGVVLLDAAEELDALATAAGQAPLSSFDAYADVPDEVLADRARDADGLPDLSGLPVTWHDPARAVATLDLLIAGTTDGEVRAALAAFRQVLADAAGRGTRFHLVIA